MVSVTILADSEHRDFGGVCNHFVDVPFMTDSEHLDRWDYLDNDGGRNQLAQAAGIHNYDGGPRPPGLRTKVVVEFCSAPTGRMAPQV